MIYRLNDDLKKYILIYLENQILLILLIKFDKADVYLTFPTHTKKKHIFRETLKREMASYKTLFLFLSLPPSQYIFWEWNIKFMSDLLDPINKVNRNLPFKSIRMYFSKSSIIHRTA